MGLRGSVRLSNELDPHTHPVTPASYLNALVPIQKAGERRFDKTPPRG